ncbi:glutathione binding-like protein [Minwuia thermotolerans]|uniref:Glutathione S-transferase n=1 Tax=Minwuia thermotolerans TaxID=2056226 RepID=A0A2M9G299_9PROT|nr:glutathione binding-like protein [Minwuia thermotolerans]PJK29843.1 glutathione S-transferase [Minwuia thermotolerans]
MIELYTWGTPNGRKVSVMLEECGLDYQVYPVNIAKDEQFDPDFLKISPNNKIPAIVDSEGPDGEPISVFETGAILIYLAKKTGKFLPAEPRAFHETMQWLMWQMGGVGPMMGQAHHFRRFAPEKIPYAIDRYTNETARLYGVLDKRVADRDWLAAGEYTIADIATFPWIARHEWQGMKLEDFPNLKRWYDRIWSRDAVKKGFEVP